MIFNHTCPNPLNNLFRNLRYHGEAHFFPPEEKNKCCLITCYPPKFCIYPDFSPCIDLPRSASPIKAFSGKAGRFGPPPPHLFLFLSLLLYLFFRKDIYSYISRARYTQIEATGNKATFLFFPREVKNFFSSW